MRARKGKTMTIKKINTRVRHKMLKSLVLKEALTQEPAPQSDISWENTE